MPTGSHSSALSPSTLRRRTVENEVFLNIPYDEAFIPLYLAYITGLVHLGLVPRATLEISGGTRRLDKIQQLIQRCRYSVHDLSRVELDGTQQPTPRFNMPFELGMAVAWELTAPKNTHTWFVFESTHYRLQRSLSDLNGTDPHIHEGTAAGVLRGLGNALNRPGAQPTQEQMMRAYIAIYASLPSIMEQTGAATPFEARPFQSLIFAARAVMENRS